MEPITEPGDLIVRYWREILIIGLFFWGQSKNSELRRQKILRVKQKYEYEACREIIPKDKLFMWPTRYYNSQIGAHTLQTLPTEEELLREVLRD